MVIAIILINIGINLIQPILIKNLIDMYSSGSLQIRLVILFCIALTLLLTLELITGIIRDYFINKIRYTLQVRLRNDIYKHSLNTLSKDSSGKVISLIYNDVDAVVGLMNIAVISLITDSITLILTMVILFYLNWKLAVISLVFFPIYYTLYRTSKRKIYNLNMDYKTKLEDLTEMLQLGTRQKGLAMRFNRQIYSNLLFHKEQKKVIEISKPLLLQQSILSGLSNFLTGILPVTFIIIGGYLLVAKQLTLGTLIAFCTYIVKMLQPISRLTQLNVHIQSALSSARRIFTFLQKKDNWQGTNQFKSFRDRITFQNVDFSYDNNNLVLSDLSFDIQKNQMVSFVGESGSGKTTILKLLSGEHQALRGNVFYDQRDIYTWSKKSFFNKVSIVKQEEEIVPGTIFQNIAFGFKNATIEQVIHVARIVGLHDFILQLPKQYNTFIYPDKIDLSVGQKQRLAIARAIIRETEILIFDEITSALDAETEQYIIKLINSLKGKYTIINVAHKLQNVINSDKVFVMDKGKIMEVGTHSELLQKGSLYKNIYFKQQNALTESSSIHHLKVK